MDHHQNQIKIVFHKTSNYSFLLIICYSGNKKKTHRKWNSFSGDTFLAQYKEDEKYVGLPQDRKYFLIPFQKLCVDLRNGHCTCPASKANMGQIHDLSWSTEERFFQLLAPTGALYVMVCCYTWSPPQLFELSLSPLILSNWWQLLATEGNFLQHMETFGNWWQHMATEGN